jgi:hypothetical protein
VAQRPTTLLAPPVRVPYLIAVVKQALAQLPSTRPGRRAGKKVLVRTDGAGGTHEFIEWLTKRRLSYSVGFTLPTTPRTCWPGSPIRYGPRLTTPTTRSVTGLGSPS